MKVKATGQAPASLPNAREAAVEDALRRCVEAAGVHVASETLVDDFTLIKDVIYTKTAGLVEHYEVLEENPDQEGLYTVRVLHDACAGSGSTIVEIWPGRLRCEP